MDENGNLIGVRETVNFDERDVADDESKKEHVKQVIENNVPFSDNNNDT